MLTILGPSHFHINLRIACQFSTPPHQKKKKQLEEFALQTTEPLLKIILTIIEDYLAPPKNAYNMTVIHDYRIVLYSGMHRYELKVKVW